MSDLQCPARLVLVTATMPPGSLPLDRLRAHAVRVVYTGSDVEPRDWVRLADELDVTWCGCEDELTDGSSQIQEIIDRHRGEAVVVVRSVGADRAPVIVHVDADGRSVHPF